MIVRPNIALAFFCVVAINQIFPRKTRIKRFFFTAAKLQKCFAEVRHKNQKKQLAFIAGKSVKRFLYAACFLAHG